MSQNDTRHQDALPLPQALLMDAESNHGSDIACHQPREGSLRTWTWSQMLDDARRLLAALRAMGLEPGDRIALLSKNCAQWLIADYALILGGYVSVPIYPTANARTVTQILTHSEARAVFVGKLDDPESLQAAIDPELIRIDMSWPGIRCPHAFDDLIRSNEPAAECHQADADEVMTILYTSGSTGVPKGAVHTHATFSFAGHAIASLMKTTSSDRILSYLPLSHCTERAYVEAAGLFNRPVLYFAESLDTFADDLRRARPTFFGSVPRLWKKFQLGVLDQVPQKKLDLLLRIPWLGHRVAGKIRRGLGLDQCRWFMSGSAPIAPSLLRWWARLGMPISEGWGMTETLAYGTLLESGGTIRTGSIGKPGPGCEIRIAEDGEVQIRTGSLMRGYYRDSEASAAVMTADGFLKTGDMGRIDADGYVSIVGRLKDQFKTAKGKYVSPVPIESLFEKNRAIESVCLTGSGLPQPVLLIGLTEAARRQEKAEVDASLIDLLETVNRQLESHERISHLIIVSDEWTTENGLLTPTLKIKRGPIEVRYASLISGPAPADRIVRESD